MNVAIVTGSHKANGESTRIGHWLAKRVEQDGHEGMVLDLHAVDFPFWDEGLWGAEGLSDKWQKLWSPWAEKLQQADGIVLLAPEYNGTVPARLKNFLHIAGGKEFAHKPGLIIGVSVSKNGVYPVVELRMASAKNNKLCFVPDHLIIRNAEQMLTSKTSPEFAAENDMLQTRITYTLEVFYEYMKALKEVRHSGKTATELFRFGM